MTTHAVIPNNLPELVRDKFNAAKEAGELTFWPTEVAILNANGVPFQLRFCAALSQKPKSSKLRVGKQPTDPFLQPPDVLLVAELAVPPSHILVLNKFAIVPQHFILATKEFKEQTHLLEEDDLGVTFDCLQAWRARGKELFAFFNSGKHSGASQPHRHIQFLPVESMMSGVEKGEWQPLTNNLASTPKLDLPFTYFGASLPPNPTRMQLHKTYLSLHEQACRAVESCIVKHPTDNFKLHDDDDDDGSSIISYNLGLTHSSMVLIPRRSEGSLISTGGEQRHSIGPIALNGTVLAGTLLVKNELEWNALKYDGSQLLKVLEVIGIPSSHHANGEL